MTFISLSRSFNTRQGSVYDFDIDMFLKISNYEDTVKQLDFYYGISKCYKPIFTMLTYKKLLLI